MEKLKQTDLRQTGIAILELTDGSKKSIPLYSLEIMQEAREITNNYFKDSCKEIKAVYATNNLMATKIEDTISLYLETYKGLPEDYMEELLSGFPYIIGRDSKASAFYYA